MIKNKKPTFIRNIFQTRGIKFAGMLVVITGVAGGLYYQSVNLRSSAATPYSVTGYRIYGSSDTPFPNGVGTTTLGDLSTSANPFSYGTSGGDKTIFSSDSITHGGIRYVFDHSRLCYNNDVPRCPGGAAISYSQPRTLYNPSSYADIWFSYVPAMPGVVMQANGYQGSIIVPYNSGLTISWGVSDASSCTASGNWGGGKSVTGGSENRSADTTVSGSKTYTLTCQGPGGTIGASVGVTVQSAPTPTPTPTPTPVPTTQPAPAPTPTPSPTTSTNSNPPTTVGQSTPALQGGGLRKPQPITVQSTQPDTIPPTAPLNFATTPGDQGVSIKLSWQSSTDNSGRVSYGVERSTDQKQWQIISGNQDSTGFADSGVKFDTHYYYRVRAFDAAGNKSDYAFAEASTSSFAGNATSSKEIVLNYQGDTIQAILPAGALTDSASCAIESLAENNVGPSVQGYVVVGGPFQILCKKADSSLVSSFNKPASIKWTLKTPKNVSGAPVYYGDETNWTKLRIASHNSKSHTDTFVLDKGTAFIAMGKLKHTPAILKVLGVVAGLLSVAGIIVWLLYRRYQKKQQSVYDDYMHKIRGV